MARQNGNECNIETKIGRETACRRTIEEIRYGKLWAEIQLPKLLTKTATNMQEVKK